MPREFKIVLIVITLVFVVGVWVELKTRTEVCRAYYEKVSLNTCLLQYPGLPPRGSAK